MANGGKDRSTRESRERARLYQARQEFHDSRARRRTRDNLIAGIAGGALIVAVLAVQTAYFVTGPGAPEPAPTTSSTPGVTPEPTDVPAPTPTSPTTNPAPTPTP